MKFRDNEEELNTYPNLDGVPVVELNIANTNFAIEIRVGSGSVAEAKAVALELLSETVRSLKELKRG